MKRSRLAFALIPALVACIPTQPPTVRIAPANMKVDTHFPGKYLAVIQTGGWTVPLKVNSQQPSLFRSPCANTVLNHNFDDGWRITAERALRGALRDVTFTDTLPTPEDLRKGGYDASVIVTGMDIDDQVTYQPLLFSYEVSATVQLDAVAVITPANGNPMQVLISGAGKSSSDQKADGSERPSQGWIGCKIIPMAARDAARHALQELGLHLAEEVVAQLKRH